MSNEIILLRAKLAAKKQELEEMKLKADNFIIAIRELVDPYEEDFTQLELDRAKVAINDFHKLWKSAKEIKEQIHKMEKDLDV